MKGAIRMFGLGAFTALLGALIIASCAYQPAAAQGQYDEADAAYEAAYRGMTEAERERGIVYE